MQALLSFVVVLALTSAGCSIVAATRAPSLEQGADACSNFLDDDLDGTLDCDDTECDGLCSEETLAACSDGRDNDGDGVTDGVDARCWHVVPPDLKRCATVFGSHLEPPIGDGTLVWRGVAAAVPDPRGGTGSVYAAADGIFRVAPAASSTGALDGLLLTAVLRVSTAVETSITLVPAGELGDATSSAVFTRYVRLNLGRTVFLQTNDVMGEVLFAPHDLEVPAWVEVTLAITGRTVSATLAIGTGAPIRFASVALPGGLADPLALDVLVQADTRPLVDVPMLSSLEIERVDLPACGRDELVPEMRAEALDLVLGVARGGPSGATRCAISSENGVGRPYSAEGDGDWRAADDAIGLGDVVGAAFAWDAERGAFVGFAAHGPDLFTGLEPTSFDRISSPDCVSWTVDPWELPPFDPSLEVTAQGSSYAISPGGEHVMRFVAARADDVGVLEVRSPSGEPDTFVVGGDVLAVGPAASALVHGGADIGIDLVGRDDLVLLATSEQGLVALTPRGSSGRFTELPRPLLEVSDVAGTFDRGRLFGAPRFLPSADPHVAHILYGGTSFVNCISCISSGSALFTTGGDE